MIWVIEDDVRTEDCLWPVGDTFHERVSYHQGQRGCAQEDAAIDKVLYELSRSLISAGA